MTSFPTFLLFYGKSTESVVYYLQFLGACAREHRLEVTTMSLKKVMALVLSLAMVLSLAACGKKTNNTTPTATPTTAPIGEATPTPTQGVEPSGVTDLSVVKEADGTLFAGSLVSKKEQSGGGEVGYDVYTGNGDKDYTDPKFYTFNDFITDTSTLNWGPCTWETSDDSSILDRISSGYYGFALNSKKDGWSVTCELAAALPEDVTKDYVGKYGIKEGDTAKAWKIKLRQDLQWNDGTPIKADDFVYSAQELLDPIMLNRRADSLYAGRQQTAH